MSYQVKLLSSDDWAITVDNELFSILKAHGQFFSLLLNVVLFLELWIRKWAGEKNFLPVGFLDFNW